MRPERVSLWAWLALMGATFARAEAALPTVDTFTATTAAMTPEDVALKIDIREWSDGDERAAVLAALDGDADVSQALRELPTIGYVWQTGTAVGYAVKYAYRSSSDGGERITFVTDRALGSYGPRPWTADGATDPPLPYSVIELRLDGQGNGRGTLSLAAAVARDPDTGAISLVPAVGASDLLTNAKLEPKPYWAVPRESAP